MAVVIPANILSRYESLYGLEARVAVENLAARLFEAREELTDWNLKLISEARGIAHVFSHAGHHSRSACEWTLTLANRLAHDAIILESRSSDGARVLAVIDATDFELVAATIEGELSAIDGHTILHPAGWPPRGIRGLPSELASWKAASPSRFEPETTPPAAPSSGAKPVDDSEEVATPKKLVLNDTASAAASALVHSEPSAKERLHIDDIDSFAEVRTVPPSAVTQFLTDGRIEVSEDSVKRAIEEILDVPFRHKDRPNELNDVSTANVIVNGSRRPTAFMLKGPGIRTKEMTIAHCGKHGDQLVRLFDTPADLFVVQFVGRISEMVIKDIEGKIAALRQRGKHAQFLIMDGQDTARLLLAYGKLNLP